MEWRRCTESMPRVSPPSEAAWDIVVVGAGIAGCATAIAAKGARPRARICLIDSGRPRPATGESIPPETRLLLQRLGVLEQFEAAGHADCLGSCSAWGSSTLGYNDFVVNPYGMGWHLDRPRFEAMLRSAAADRGVDVVHGRFRDCHQEAAGWAVTLTGRTGHPHHLGTRFLVDATGSASVVARHLGARPVPHDRLVLATAFYTDENHDSRSRLTMLEAAPTGWWYAAGLPCGRVAVAYASDPAQFRSAGAARWPAWQAQLNQTTHIAASLAASRPLAPRLTVQSAPSFHLDRAAGPGWLAVGDAAASYDPLSAQGIYKALAGGIDAADAVSRTPSEPPHDCIDYAATVNRDFDTYAHNHRYLYGIEQRFARTPFWARRHAAPAAHPRVRQCFRPDQR